MSNIESNSKQKIKVENKGWTIKGIEIETRIAIQKAAKKEGMTLGKYCNTKLREVANNTLKENNIIPVQQVEIRNEVTAQINSLKDELSTIIKLAIEDSKPKQKNLLKKIFG